MAYDYQSNRSGRGQGGSRDDRRGGGQGRNGQRSNGGQGHSGDFIRNGQGRGNNSYERSERPPKKEYDPLVDKATAPYNFIPLPLVVLPAPLVSESGATYAEQYASYIGKNGNYSGVIDLDVLTKTPFYIGGGTGSDFFDPAECGPVIPGSTIRGMVKNILKIIACGAMRPSGHKEIGSEEIEGDGDFFDHKLYFRTMAAKRGIGIKVEYDRELVTKGAGGRGESKAKAGFLIRVGKEYYISPAESVPVKDIATVKKFQVKNNTEASNGNNGACIKWQWQHEGVRGVACFTGEMNTGGPRGKKHYTIHYDPDWSEGARIRVPDHVVIDYQDDGAGTRRGVDLFKVGLEKDAARKFTGQDDVSYVVPCFYVADQEKKNVRHFGFGRYYRVPYRYRISEHVPEALWKGVPPDFTDALFGRKEDWGSRLCFENCVSEKATVQPLETKETRILSSPNPTAFQHYLIQDKATGERNHWNSTGDDGQPVSIRGYKLYWHQKDNPNAWQHRKDEPSMSGMKPISPIASGAKFHGRIRFDRLSALELGALLSVFDLAACDPSVCFKLGRGKSIGMGSVRIDATPKLIEKNAYTTLFAGDGWENGERKMDSMEIKQYVDAFASHVREKLKNAPNKNALSQYELSQKSLVAMLNWENTKTLPQWNKETILMQETRDKKTGKLTVDDRFKERLMLPTALDVIKRAGVAT